MQLAEEGYDVWLMNHRGTWYSQEHEKYNAKDDMEYWLYNMGHIGRYDIPANIDIIKGETGVERVFYIGYSMGTTQMFHGFAHHSEYYRQNLLKVIQFGPCFVPTNPYPDFIMDDIYE